MVRTSWTWHGFDVPGEAMRALVLDDSAPVPVGTLQYPAAFGV